MNIISNRKPREVIFGFELDNKEAAEFDYLDWTVEDGSGPQGEFFRYKGQLYDIGEFTRPTSGFSQWWDGIHSDTYFSGLCIKLVDDGERVVVGRYYA